MESGVHLLISWNGFIAIIKNICASCIMFYKSINSFISSSKKHTNVFFKIEGSRRIVNKCNKLSYILHLLNTHH